MTHTEIINLWPSMAEFARETGIPYQSVRQFRRRGLIPYWFWTSVVKAAEKRGLRGISYESLAEGANAAKTRRARAAS